MTAMHASSYTASDAFTVFLLRTFGLGKQSFGTFIELGVLGSVMVIISRCILSVCCACELLPIACWHPRLRLVITCLRHA